MADKESYADRLGKYLGDWSQDADDTAFVEEARALVAELDQCLTAHAELNDKACRLEDALDESKQEIRRLKDQLLGYAI